MSEKLVNFRFDEEKCQVPYMITCRHQGDGWN